MPTNTPSVVPPTGGSGSNTYNGYFNIVAWGVTIGLGFLIAKTKLGYTFLYYFALASIIIVLAVGSPTIATIFNAVNPNTKGKN